MLQTEQSPALRSPPGKEKLIISTAQTTGFACGLTIFACLLYSIIRTAFVDSVSKTPGEPTVARHSQASAVFALAGVLTVISVPVHCLTGYLISLRVVLRDQYPPHGADVASAAAAVVQPSPSSQYIPENAPAAAVPAAPAPAFGAAGSGALPPQAGSAASAPAPAARAPAAPAAGAAAPAPGAAAAADELVVVAREHHQPPRTPQIPAANVSTLPPPEERRGTAKILLLPSVLRSLLMLHILLALSGAYGTVGSPLFFVALVLPALLVAAVLMGVVRATEKQLPPDYLRRVGSLTVRQLSCFFCSKATLIEHVQLEQNTHKPQTSMLSQKNTFSPFIFRSSSRTRGCSVTKRAPQICRPTPLASLSLRAQRGGGLMRHGRTRCSRNEA